MEENKYTFRPVVGSEKRILESVPEKGTVWFAKDTKKIYYSDGNSFLSMGGNTGIYYGNYQIPEEEKNEKEFEFPVISIEGNDSADDGELKIPNPDDIILNIPDGCFYRVMDIEESEETGEITFRVIKMTIAGSGGGNGPAAETGGSASVAYLNPDDKNGIDILYGQDCDIGFIVEAKDAAGDDTTGGIVTWKLDKKTIATQSVSVGENHFNVGPYLSSAVSGPQELKGNFSLDIGTSANYPISKTWKITAANISLNWEYDIAEVISSNSFTLNWNIIGGGGIEKTTHIIIDNNREITSKTTTVGDQHLTIDRDAYGLNHGMHRFKMYISFKINDITFETPSIEKEIIFVDADNITPIIALGDYKKEMSQYDTLMLPVYIYNSTFATLFENGVQKDRWTDLNPTNIKAELRYWSYNPTEEGLKHLSIVINTLEYLFNIQVNKLDLKAEESDGYAFKIKASEFSSNSALQHWSFETPEKEQVSLSFSSNFDWVNGGIKTEELEDGSKRPYICIKAGTNLTIGYDLFKANNRYGKNIKVAFKVSNCGKYDAEIINSYDRESEIGLLMTAQEALFHSSSNAIKTQYCEDNYIEYEIDITPFAPQGSKDLQYIMPWLAGVPAGITTFSIDSFQQPEQNRTKIVVGSEDCDVYLYLFKVYERHLTDKEHLDNFIMDALNAQEIINRYTRNDVLSDSGNGEIDWAKVVEKNPNCWVHLYTIPRMTKNKKDEIGKSYLSDKTGESPKYYALYKDGNNSVPVIQAGTDVDCPFSYKVQGTSSEKYVISAANLDTNFKTGFIDSEGNKISKFQLDNTVPGENYFNTKVNVASCEGANNALNAQYYNDHQPYVSAAKAQNNKKRDTMLFKPGIVFIKDENPYYEIATQDQNNLDLNIFRGSTAYKNNPFHKQYAICNFGNSKKNKATLHDVDNPSEICIEVTDNQNIGQHMCQVSGRKEILVTGADGSPTTDVQAFDITQEEISYNETTKTGNSTYDAFVLSMTDKDYDVRYVNGTDGVDNASPQQIIGFFNLVKWFATNDPNPQNPNTHPYGYTGQAFTENTPGARYYENPEILIESGLYSDELCTHQITAADLTADGVYYKKVTKKDTYPNPNNPEEMLEKEIITIESAINGADYRLTGYGVTFEPYTFKNTVSFETGNGYHHTYSSKLGGLKVNTYAKTYFNDSHEYRMAKLLSECEDHLIMDSIIYHYLFIEKHLMVDNVAKNTFWTSEDKDNQYWSLIKDYDNDTADGIDNDGKLSFTYGIEPTDKQPDGLSYFNAPNSVWFNFVHGLENVRQHLYVSLSSGSNSVWNVQSYLKAFDDWQSAIPERCWIEDYYRKYIRPYEQFDDTSYLAKLEGGQKKYQRRQFEIYQNDYLNSKYRYTNGESIYLRANEEQPSRINIPVTMYSDCYIYQSWAQNIVRNRVKRGETYTITVPSTISRLDDATVYWYLPQTYSTIGDLGVIKPKGVTMGGAKRLQSLDVTDLNPDQSKENLENKAATISLQNEYSLAIGQATLLRHLNLIGLKSETGTFPLDLTNLKSLQDFDGRNSDFTTIQLPSGAPITSIKINNPKIISMIDLHQVEEFSVQNYGAIEDILIDNIDDSDGVNSLNIVLNANNLKKYCLQNVNWTLSDSAHINDTNHTIDFLETLMSKTAMDINDRNQMDKKDALTGTLTITSSAYSGNFSLEIYNKYAGIFPKLDIIFEDENCKLSEVTILNGDGQEVWKKKFRGSTQLKESFFTSGANGNINFLDEVIRVLNSKQNTLQNSYIFNNTWTITTGESTNTVRVYPTSDNAASYCPIDNSVNAVSYANDITIKPNYDISVRRYEIVFLNEDGSSSGVPSQLIEYNTPYSDINYYHTIPVCKRIPSEESKVYEFVGYALEPNSTEPVDFAELGTVGGTKTFYAVFKESSIYDVDFSKYFNYSEPNVSYSDGFDTVGVEITGFKTALTGKIVIPATYEGTPVVGIGASAFKQNKAITHVFVNSTDDGIYYLRKVGYEAFNECSSLKYFDFSIPSLTTIDTMAFRQCALQTYSITGPNLSKIGVLAFNQAFVAPAAGVGVIRISSSVETICQQAFSNNGALNYEIGEEGKNSKLNLSKVETNSTNTDMRRIYSSVSAIQITLYGTKYTSPLQSFQVSFSNSNKTARVSDCLIADTLEFLS